LGKNKKKATKGFEVFGVEKGLKEGVFIIICIG